MSASNNNVHWGRELEAQLRPQYPNLADAVRPGLPVDCSGLFTFVKKHSNENTQLEALCNAFEGALQLLSDKNHTDCASLADSHHKLTTLQQQFAAQASQLAAQSSDRTALQQQLADSQQQLTTLQQQFTAQGSQLAAQARLAETLSATLTGLTNSQQRNTGGQRRLTDDPEKFSGAEKDISKRQQQYANWRSQIKRCFGVDSAIFNTEFRKIQHISGLLTDDAYDANRDHFDTITENPNEPEYWYWETAADVFRAFDSQYETLDLSQQASQAFDNLWMTNKPFQNFLAEFNRLASKCNKTPEQKVEALRVKVSQELSDEIAHRGDRPSKSEFNKWAEMCQQIYNNLEEQKHVDKLRNARSNAGRSRNPTSLAPAPPAHAVPPIKPAADVGDPMILDANRDANRDARHEYCVQHGLCFYCAKPGHTKFACPEKPATTEPSYRGRGAHQSPRGGAYLRNALHDLPYQPPRSRGLPYQQPNRGYQTPSRGSSSQPSRGAPSRALPYQYGRGSNNYLQPDAAHLRASDSDYNYTETPSTRSPSPRVLTPITPESEATLPWPEN